MIVWVNTSVSFYYLEIQNRQQNEFWKLLAIFREETATAIAHSVLKISTK